MRLPLSIADTTPPPPSSLSFSSQLAVNLSLHIRLCVCLPTKLVLSLSLIAAICKSLSLQPVVSLHLLTASYASFCPQQAVSVSASSQISAYVSLFTASCVSVSSHFWLCLGISPQLENPTRLPIMCLLLLMADYHTQFCPVTCIYAHSRFSVSLLTTGRLSLMTTGYITDSTHSHIRVCFY